MENLRRKAEQLGILLSHTQLEQFQRYYEMLVETNKVMNLTTIVEYEEVIDKHFLDSILIGKHMDFKTSLSVIDVGTGAGFPGIPLKIVFPQIQVTLLDSLNKRVLFLEDVIRKLELSGIEAVHCRAEDGGRNPRYREKYDICVSRAVANLSVLCEYCLPFVKPSGWFISYKSAQIQEEVKQAERAIHVLGGSLREVVPVTLPESDIVRQFVMIEKTGHTPKPYPRKAGTVGKMPIV